MYHLAGGKKPYHMVQPYYWKQLSGRTASDTGCTARDVQVDHEKRGPYITTYSQ